MPAAALLAVLATLVPAILGQFNTTYKDYSTEAQPDLDESIMAAIDFSFPDCNNGPLGKTLVCDKSASAHDRAVALISLFTFEELVNSTGNSIPEIPRLGLPAYNVWSEALHGIARGNYTDSGDFSWATSFPSPILTMAGLNRTMINKIGDIISTQGRAFNNVGRFGLNVYSPNINSFRHPVWGRGQETPGEDAYCLCSAYGYEYITGIQGGVDPDHLKMVANAKHYAGYDLENWDGHSRLGNDLNITQQDLAEYFTPQFLSAVRDAKVHSVMSSYNAVNGVPSTANSFFLQTLLRDTWGFVEDGFVSSDCDSVYNVFNPHEYAANVSGAAAGSLRAGTDIDCGRSYQYYLNESLIDGGISRSEIERGVIRLYSNLVRLGYFDGGDSPFRNLKWSDVVSTDAQNIAYEAAIEGIVLLKNDGTLPLAKNTSSVALIGPWGNATEQMQGNYYSAAPYLTSPLAALQASDLDVHYAFGTNISSESTDGFEAAISAAKKSDVIVFAGGIDNTIETEGIDRMNITWPGNQLQLVKELSQLGKPLVVLQMGGGQVDSSSLKSNKNVNSIIWGGYPGQSGGQALLDIITGKRAPAGRLTATQYPAKYATEFPATDMTMRPNGKNPGQTYMWYTGTPVYEFGHGLFYSKFKASMSKSRTRRSGNGSSFDIMDLLSQSHQDYNTVEQVPFFNYTVGITNTGGVLSDYTAMLFANTTAGPKPYPNKWLVGFDRLGGLKPHASQQMTIPISLDSLARTDSQGNRVVYPGKYELALNNERWAVQDITLTGDTTVISKWPLDEQQIPHA